MCCTEEQSEQKMGMQCPFSCSTPMVNGEDYVKGCGSFENTTPAYARLANRRHTAQVPQANLLVACTPFRKIMKIINNLIANWVLSAPPKNALMAVLLLCLRLSTTKVIASLWENHVGEHLAVALSELRNKINVFMIPVTQDNMRDNAASKLRKHGFGQATVN